MPSSFSFSTSIIFTISSFANLSFVPINPLPEIASIFIPITTVGCAGLHRNHAILTEIYHTVFNFIRRRTAGTEQTTRIIKNVTDIYHNIRIRGGHSVNKHCFHGLYAESCISNRKFFICYSNVVYNACIRLIRLLKSLLVQAVHTNRLKTILNIHKKLYYIHFFCRFICCYIIIIANIQKFFGLL